jgi:TnsA-like endonuclease N terminal
MAGDVRVSFRDAAGRESEAGLALVSAAMLASGRPWRVFRWRQGQAHYSGWYWSATTGGHVVYESRLELARLLLADFDPQVAVIAAQPFLVTAPSGGRVRRHVPDFLVIGRDGGVRVVNVKPADQMEVPKVAEALAWAGEVFAARGWQHEIWSGAEPVFLANVRFLAGYRFADRVDAALADAVARHAPPGATIGELERGWREGAVDARPPVLHLLWRGVLRADLMAPLSSETRLERAA